MSIHSTHSCTECFGTNLSGTINKRTKFFSVCGNASNLSLKYRKLPAHISEDSPLNTNKELDIILVRLKNISKINNAEVSAHEKRYIFANLLAFYSSSSVFFFSQNAFLSYRASLNYIFYNLIFYLFIFHFKSKSIM